MSVLAGLLIILGAALMAAVTLADRARHRRRLLTLRAAYHDDRLRNVTPYSGPVFTVHGRVSEPDRPAVRHIL